MPRVRKGRGSICHAATEIATVRLRYQVAMARITYEGFVSLVKRFRVQTEADPGHRLGVAQRFPTHPSIHPFTRIIKSHCYYRIIPEAEFFFFPWRTRTRSLGRMYAATAATVVTFFFLAGRSRGVVRVVPGVCLGLAPPSQANQRSANDLRLFESKTLGGGGSRCSGRWVGGLVGREGKK